MSTAEKLTLIGFVIVLIGWLVGPLVMRFVRTLGMVQCTVDSWRPTRTAYSPGGDVAEERRLQVSFSNRKEVPVTVSEMRVEFYKESQRLEEWARPLVEFVDERDQKSPLGPVNLPPHQREQRTISATPGRDDIVRELQKADRAVFVASIDGVGDKRVELTPPW